jgi:hypothetical protein
MATILFVFGAFVASHAAAQNRSHSTEMQIGLASRVTRLAEFGPMDNNLLWADLLKLCT